MWVNNPLISRLDLRNTANVNLSNYQLKNIQVISNKAARLISITCVTYDERITTHHIELPIKARIMYNICTLTLIALITQKPTYLYHKINWTRTKLFVPIPKTITDSVFCQFSAQSIYKSLPDELTQVNDNQKFN